MAATKKVNHGKQINDEKIGLETVLPALAGLGFGGTLAYASIKQRLANDKVQYQTPNIITHARETGTLTRSELGTLINEADDIINKYNAREAQITELKSKDYPIGRPDNYLAKHMSGIREMKDDLQDILRAPNTDALINGYSDGDNTFYAMACGGSGQWNNGLREMDYTDSACGSLVDSGATSIMAAQNEIKLNYNRGNDVILGLGILIAAVGYIVSHAMQNPKK